MCCVGMMGLLCGLRMAGGWGRRHNTACLVVSVCTIPRGQQIACLIDYFKSVGAHMAMVRNLSAFIPLAANIEGRIRARGASSTESSSLVLYYVTLGNPWDQVEGAASLDLGWGKRRRGSCSRGRMDSCGTGCDEERCYTPHVAEDRYVWFCCARGGEEIADER